MRFNLNFGGVAAMRIFLIRHADPDYWRDTITEIGHRQAKALARSLEKVQIDRLFSSPLGRARATAKYIAESKNLQLEILDWLAELDGNFGADLWAWNISGSEVFKSGKLPDMENWDEIVPYGRKMVPQWKTLAQNFDKFLSEFGYIRDCLRYRIISPNNLTIALVSHAGTILTLLSYLVNMPLPLAYIHFSCDPSSLTELIWEESSGYAVPRIVRLNDMSHWKNCQWR